MAAGGVLVGRGYVSIRPEFEGDWSRSVNSRASSAGRSGASAFGKAFGAGLKTVGGLAAVAVSANLTGVAAAAAVLAPALATAGTAAAALKIGLSGVGEAFKAAFADSSAEAASAASATRAVESAQRGLAGAQRALADARVQAAERVRDAQRAVLDAERDLADAQREARDVQADLNGARREAARALQDMNQQLAESRLDEREAVLRLKQAEDELKAAQKKPGVTPQELERLQLAYERAQLNLTEQRRDTKRLAADTKAANKAGVEGSEQVLSVKERIADANRTVADRERALADAQAGVDKARQDGARQIADAQRAVAEAAQAVADAQAAAAAQTSKLDEAMAKLAPNARSFVNAIRGLAPAWDNMRLSVQNKLFEGLDTAVTGLAGQAIPILQRQLTVTAGIWNEMAKSAISAVSEMAKTGMLEQILQGTNRAFAQLKDAPGQLLNSFAILTTAAQPAFERLMGGLAEGIASFEAGLARAFASGGLEQAINTAFGILQQFGQLLGNVFGVISEIFRAASDAGGQIIGALSAAFGELRRVLALPEIQAQLRTLFASVAQIVAALVPVLGAVVQALVPLLAAIAPAVAQIATVVGPLLGQLATMIGQALGPVVATLGPALVQLVTTLSAALMPIISALLPVVTQVGVALLQIVQAVTPLLEPIGDLITGVIVALAPALTPFISLVTSLVQVLVGPLSTIVRALTPALLLVSEVIAQVFAAVEPLLGPVVTLVGQAASLLAGLFVTALTNTMAALEPLLPVGIQLIESVIGALVPILPVVGAALAAVSEALVALTTPLAGVVAQLAEQLAPIIASLAPVVSQLGGVLAGVLAAALPPLTDALLILVESLSPLWPLLGQILGMAVQLGADLLGQLLPPLMELVQAGVDLVVALLPILPPLAQVIGLVVELAVRVLSWLLPPLVDLASFLVGKLAGALGTAIGWLSKLVGIVVKVITWVSDKLGPALKWLWTNIVRPVFQWIGDKGKWLWEKALSPAFEGIKKGVKAVSDSFDKAKGFIDKAWSKLSDIAKKPVKFIIETVYNKGIVPTWNKIATAFGADPLKTIPLPKGFARGGILPGQSSFRQGDDQLVPMRRGEGVYVSEAMRDPYERARLHAVNSAAMRGKPLSQFQGFAKGGIFDWVKNTASSGVDLAKTGVSWLKDGVKASAKAGLNAVVKPLLDKIAGSKSLYRDMISGIPKKMISSIVNFSGKADEKLGAAGIGGGGFKSGLAWARTQNGKPYQWGGNGNPSWDCSGLVSAIESVIRGQKPHRRWATGAFAGKTAPPGWQLGGKSPYMIGITNAGVGHTAGTINGVNVESRGGDGVVIGSKARSYKDGLFTHQYAYKGTYDSGGYLQPGLNLAYNGTGRPEPVFTTQQAKALTSMGGRGETGPARFEGDLYLDSGEFLGKVRGEAAAVVDGRFGDLKQTLTAGRRL
ncbi:hypothetical protein AB0L83_22085 [Streptomyces sp. NPDC052071]|uniref:phage tail protein n=1 Tax=Streptomyces sp. NPDC052071 TaxID=3156666 RepID=UPI003418BDE9